jgi:drug/metabolite transporter (DMT)-like permease
MSDRSRARLDLVLAAALFATGGPAIKACALSPWQVASFRAAIAALFIALALREARAHLSWRAALVGVAHGATMVLFVYANKLTTAANSIFLQDSALLYVLLLGPWLLRERLARHDAVVVALVVAGMALFFTAGEAPVASAPDPARGNALAAASGVSWALTVVGLRWLGAREEGGGALAAVLCGNTFACLAALPMALPFDGGTPRDLALLVYLGVVQIGVAYFLVARGIRRVSALEASLLFLLEPVLNPLLTWLLQGERPHPSAIAGGALIVSATAFKAWRERAPAVAAAELRAGSRADRTPAR